MSVGSPNVFTSSSGRRVGYRPDQCYCSQGSFGTCPVLFRRYTFDNLATAVDISHISFHYLPITRALSNKHVGTVAHFGHQRRRVKWPGILVPTSQLSGSDGVKYEMAISAHASFSNESRITSRFRFQSSVTDNCR